MTRTGEELAYSLVDSATDVPIFDYNIIVSTKPRPSVRPVTHSINHVICRTVHVPLPNVHRQKQIPLNARTWRL